MRKQLFQNKLRVKKSSLHGYGVFAGKTIKKGEIIEECYMILSRGGDKTLEDFYFEVPHGRYAFFTGFGSIYNHSDEPNADYTLHVKKRLAIIRAKKIIRKGEEIYVYYGDEWFSCRRKKPKKNKKKLFLTLAK